MWPSTRISPDDSLAQAIARKTNKTIVSEKTLSKLIKRTAAVRNSPNELNAAREEIGRINSPTVQRQMLRVMDYVIAQHPETMDVGRKDVVNSLISVTMSMAKGKPVSGLHIRNLDLRNFNLQEADLRGLDLSNRHMQGADMRRVYAKGANMKGGILLGVHAQEGNFDGTNMTEATLTCADFSYANLNNVNASKAKMTGTKLIHAKTLNMNTEGAKTAETIFSSQRRANMIIYQ